MKNEEEIRKKAHKFYEKRGRKDGYDLDDWLRAEIIIRKKTMFEIIKCCAEIASIIVAIVAIAGVALSFFSYKDTLKQSEKQLEQAKELYELQNRPILVINDAGWYPTKTLADIAIRIKMSVYNGGKSIPSNAKVIKDIFLRIKTDTLQRFPGFSSDIKPSEQVDVDKDKRIQQYLSYRKKPFNDIKEYIFNKKGQVTGIGIIEYFRKEYKSEGYEFIPYRDLESKGSFMVTPGDAIPKETGRSISIPRFEDEILKDGGDILVFYYAIEYIGPLKTKKYVTHYIWGYESLTGAKEMLKSGYPFTYCEVFTEEIQL